MSLINQVLKDLEKRHASRADVRGLPPSVRPLPDQGGRRTGWLVALGGLAIVVVAGAAAWWFILRTAPAPHPPAPAAEPIAQRPSAPLSLPAPNPDQPLAAAPAPAPGPAQVSPAPAQPAASTSAGTRQTLEEQRAPAALSPTPPAAEPVDTASAAAKASAPRKPEAARTKPADTPLALEEPSIRSPEVAGSIDKQVRPLSSQALAESEFRRGMSLLQQGRAQDAEAAWQVALAADPSHEQARQALLGAMLERGGRAEAEALLQEGLQANPSQIALAMLLARLQLDRGAQQEALETLLASLPNAQRSPDYLAMTAAVMARASRPYEAAALYEAALRMNPNNAVWSMGLGLALRADGRPQEALTALQRARDLKTLNPDLQAYVERQIRELK